MVNLMPETAPLDTPASPQDALEQRFIESVAIERDNWQYRNLMAAVIAVTLGAQFARLGHDTRVATGMVSGAAALGFSGTELVRRSIRSEAYGLAIRGSQLSRDLGEQQPPEWINQGLAKARKPSRLVLILAGVKAKKAAKLRTSISTQEVLSS